MTIMERLRNFSRLKETKETRQLKAKQVSGLNLFLVKDIIMIIGKTLILVTAFWSVGECPDWKGFGIMGHMVGNLHEGLHYPDFLTCMPLYNPFPLRVVSK